MAGGFADGHRRRLGRGGQSAEGRAGQEQSHHSAYRRRADGRRVAAAGGRKIAKTLGVKVYTIGIGTNGMVTIPDPYADAFGRTVLQPGGVSRWTSRRFKQIADATGGKYFSAQDPTALEDVYAEIDRLEKSPSEGRLYSEYRELYQ